VLDIIADENFKAYDEFYTWLQSLTQERSEPTDNFIETDIILSILSSANNIIKQFKYINCVPTSLGAVQFQATVADTDIITFPITFKIDTFESLTV